KIVDFGIAKPLDEQGLRFRIEHDAGGGLHDMTATGQVVGTLHYVAPEQVRGDPTDERVDVWSFGVTMYQLLSGQRPFEGLGHPEVLAHLSDLDRDMPRLDAIAPDVPAALVELTHHCLEKRPELRMASAAELIAGLEALVRAPAEPTIV